MTKNCSGHMGWALAAWVLAFGSVCPAVVFTHEKSISLGSAFNSTSGYGDNPLAVAFDGTSAYVGGFVNSNPAAPGTVGVVKIENVVGSGTLVLTPLPATQFPSIAWGRGINALAYEATTQSLVIALDTGERTTSVITRRRASDGSVGTAPDSTADWTRIGPGLGTDAPHRPFAMAIDPIGDNTVPDDPKPGVGWLTQGGRGGRRMMLKLSDGTDFWTGSDGPDSNKHGGVINSWPTVYNTLWRAMAFDSAGNIALSAGGTTTAGVTGGVAFGLRHNPNQWKTLDASPKYGATSSSAVKNSPNCSSCNNVGQGVVIIEGVPPVQLLAFSVRADPPMTLTDLGGGASPFVDSHVQIRNLDGSKTGLDVTELTGDENGIGTAWEAGINNQKELAVGTDATGRTILLVCDFAGRRLDVYVVATAGGCCLPNASCVFTSEEQCALQDGRYRGDGVSCDSTLCCPRPFADADIDNDVDQADFSLLQACYTGEDGGLLAGCECFDRDNNGIGDGDVDADDLSAFELCASGPGIAVNSACDPS